MRICSRVLASREVECTALYQPSQNVLFFWKRNRCRCGSNGAGFRVPAAHPVRCRPHTARSEHTCTTRNGLIRWPPVLLLCQMCIYQDYCMRCMGHPIPYNGLDTACSYSIHVSTSSYVNQAQNRQQQCENVRRQCHTAHRGQLRSVLYTRVVHDSRQ